MQQALVSLFTFLGQLEQDHNLMDHNLMDHNLMGRNLMDHNLMGRSLKGHSLHCWMQRKLARFFLRLFLLIQPPYHVPYS
jgi:hypothetical protein